MDDAIEPYWQELPDDIDDDEDNVTFLQHADTLLKREIREEETRWRPISCNTKKRDCGTSKSTYYRKK